MLKVLSNILCDLDPTVKVIGQKAGICDGVPSTSALVLHYFFFLEKKYNSMHFERHFAFQNALRLYLFAKKPEKVLGFTSKFR